MTEQALQKAVAAYLRVAMPADAWWTAVNPIPAKSKAAAGLSKAMGMRAGVPDLVGVYQGRPWAIELKTGTGSPSRAQRLMHAEMRDAGVRTMVCRSVDEVWGFLDALSIPLKARAA
mgnify:CR=1 FL=1